MTVSYTFNRPSQVAEATRARVLKAAARLGYRPDQTARALRSGRTRQLGVVVGGHLSYLFDDPHAAQFLAGVAYLCVAEDLGVVLIPTRGDGATPVVLNFRLDRARSGGDLRGRDLPPPDLTDLEQVRFPVTGARLAGYRDALTAAGQAWAELRVPVVPRNQREEGALAAARALQTLGLPPRWCCSP